MAKINWRNHTKEQQVSQRKGSGRGRSQDTHARRYGGNLGGGCDLLVNEGICVGTTPTVKGPKLSLMS